LTNESSDSLGRFGNLPVPNLARAGSHPKIHARLTGAPTTLLFESHHPSGLHYRRYPVTGRSGLLVTPIKAVMRVTQRAKELAG